MAKDDDKYVQLMDRYKVERLNNPKEAVAYLEAAIKLREEGDVSKDAFRGGAYL
jgi:hypothetical protein